MQLQRAAFAVLFALLLATGRADPQKATGKAESLPACACGSFRVVSDLEQVRAGDVVEFFVESRDPVVLGRKFEWTTSAGTIISGQGTGRIRVQTTTEMLEPKPAPEAKAKAAGDPHGFFFQAFTKHRRLRIDVTARLADGVGCTCSAVSGSVFVGRGSLPRNVPADVIDLKLSAKVLMPGCPPPSSLLIAGQQEMSTSMIVDVATVAADPEKDVITYSYTVSGGRIVGTGGRVKWDLTDVLPGPYWIEALGDDGGTIPGKKQQREVTVEPCMECGLCICPMVEVKGPETISWADTVIFTASVEGGSYNNPVTYKWEVTNGLIISGQDSPSVRISASPDTAVRVKLGGLTSCNCLDELVRVYKNGRLQLQP